MPPAAEAASAAFASPLLSTLALAYEPLVSNYNQ
jgi:hypothetical protein